MSYSYPEIKNFLGLFAQANSFSLPDGAMEVAENIVINDDNVITKTRGFYQYFSPTLKTLNQLFNYQNKLVSIYEASAAYFTDTGSSPNYTGTEHVLTGQSFTCVSPRVSRGLEQNANQYFTADNGVMKLDAYNGVLFLAGAPPGLDIRGAFTADNGPILSETEYAVRVVFGRTDANNNLILGAPGDILTLTNSKVLAVAYTSTHPSDYLVAATTSAAHNLSSGMSVIVSGGSNPAVDGTHAIVVTGLTTFTFHTTSDPATGTFNYTSTRQAIYEFTIPSDISDVTQQWFYQIYRTSQSGSALISPTADFRLIDQVLLTSAEIAAHFVTYIDEVDDVLVEFAPELYTNPNSREGELQANYRPPLCDDMALFNNYVFYANCETRQTLEVDVIDTDSLAAADYIEVKIDSVTRRYVAQAGVGNRTVRSDSITNSGGDLRVDYVAHGLTNGETIYISTITAGTLTAGTYFVVSAATDTFKISLTSGGTPILYSAVTSLYFEGVTNGTYPIFQLDKTSSTVSAQLRNTAQGIVKAINRDQSSLIYANYTSGITDTPGKMQFTAKGFTGVIYVRANTTTAGAAFYPVLPSSFASGTQVFSKNDDQPNVVYISKVGEPEAVPYVNQIPVGSRNKAIKRIFALRNSVIVLKEDGVFKITGDNPINFTVTILDNTVQVVAANSGATLNNQVYFLAINGICIATDSSVEIVSRRIENRIENIIGLSNISEITSAVAYDSDRTYRIATAMPNDSTKTVTYFHNAINDTWTESDQLFNGGVVGPNDIMYYISTDNKILKERKVGTRIDYGNQNYAITVTTVDADAMGALVVSTDVVPQEGDFLVLSNVITRISAVRNTSGSNYQLTFFRTTNLTNGSTPILYARIVSNIRMAPFHAGVLERGKQFAQMQLHTRSPSITKIQCTFSGQTFGGSEVTNWIAALVSGNSGGWGFEPWGFFPWGLADQINNFFSTQPAPVVRLYVPLFQQRNTFIQATLLHQEGGEAIDIQAMSWAVRAYQERVSK